MLNGDINHRILTHLTGRVIAWILVLSEKFKASCSSHQEQDDEVNVKRLTEKTKHIISYFVTNQCLFTRQICQEKHHCDGLGLSKATETHQLRQLLSRKLKVVSLWWISLVKDNGNTAIQTGLTQEIFCHMTVAV